MIWQPAKNTAACCYWLLIWEVNWCHCLFFISYKQLTHKCDILISYSVGEMKDNMTKAKIHSLSANCDLMLCQHFIFRWHFCVSHWPFPEGSSWCILSTRMRRSILARYNVTPHKWPSLRNLQIIRNYETLIILSLHFVNEKYEGNCPTTFFLNQNAITLIKKEVEEKTNMELKHIKCHQNMLWLSRKHSNNKIYCFLLFSDVQISGLSVVYKIWLCQTWSNV